jgi:secreted trypsin-like serine protease
MKFLNLILTFNFARALPSGARIFGGEIVEDKPGERGKLHYLALLTGVEDTICSGIFIKTNWVLTAAHCLFDLESTRIFAGPTTNFTSADEYRVVEISRHPEFEPKDLKNDIALLKVESVVSLASDFPLLPSYPRIELEYDEDSCFAAGYGLSSANPFIVDGHLYSVGMPIIDSDTCRTHNTKLENFYATVEYEKLICAGEVGVADSCTGDSGGPLICLNKDGEEIIAGLTSFGPSPCGTGYGVYTKVSDHSRWIDSMTNNEENVNASCCTEVVLESNIEGNVT